MEVRSAAVAVTLAALAFAGPCRANCLDGIRNGPESDVDCGGDCLPCEARRTCAEPHDCASGRCAGGVCEERPHVPGSPIPPGYHPEQSQLDGGGLTRKIGAVAFGLGYGAAYAAALSLPGELSWMYAPVIGPWVEVADRGQARRGLIALDGLLQTVGAGLLLGGFFAGGEQLVRDDAVVARVRVSPVVLGRGGYGVFMHTAF